MSSIDGSVTRSNGSPVNGATVKLWDYGAFSSPPAKNTALPSGTHLVDTVTSGPTHGYDGAYRFNNVPYGDYWISIEFEGTIGWSSANIGQVSGDFTPGNIEAAEITANNAFLGFVYPNQISGGSADMGQINGTQYLMGGQPFSRYVTLNPVSTVLNFLVTTSTIGKTTVTLTALPTTGVVAAAISFGLRNAGDGQQGNMGVFTFGATDWANRAYSMQTNQYSTAFAVVGTGGTNNRQIQYDVSHPTPGTSILYFLKVVGYWTTS